MDFMDPSLNRQNRKHLSLMEEVLPMLVTQGGRAER